MTIEVTAPRPTEEEILAYRLQQERGDQELGIYNRLLEEANEREKSFEGHLNSLEVAGLLEGPEGNRYDLFMKKYKQDMDYQRRFGDQLQKERRSGKTKNDEDMDPFVLEELIKQRKILNEIDKKHRKGISSGEYARLANGGPLTQVQVGPDERETLDSQVAIIEMQKEAIRDAIREKGAPLTDEELNNIRQSYSPNYGNTDLDYTKDQMGVYDKNSGINYVYESLPGLADGGSPEQELVNQRIAELMMEEPVNEMRAVSPDMFERQKLGIERLLSNLYEPRRARDIAETISTGMDFTPLGDPAALAEGFQMMGDDQPFMGAALMAGSVFTNMPANKLKGLLKKADEKLDNLRTRKYQAESKMKGGLDKADFDEGFKESNKIQADINKTEKEITEIKEALNPTAVSGSGTKEPDFFQSLAESNPSFKKMLVEGRKDAGYIKPVKDESGIINATPEINRLFREISESPSRINTPQHQEAAKLTGEQLRKINQNIQKLEPTERDRVAELIQKLLEDR